MYTLHLIASQIITDSKSLYGQQGYEYVIPLKTRSESEYFSIRKQWFDQLDRPNYRLLPVIEGTVKHQGKTLPLLGIDPFVFSTSHGSQVPAIPSNFAFLRGESLLAFGQFAKIGESISGHTVSHVSPSQVEYVLADISLAQEILNRKGELDSIWLQSVSSKNLKWWDWIMPGISDLAKPSTMHAALKELEAKPFTWFNPAEQFNRAIAFQLAILSMLALAVSGFVIYQIVQTAIFRRQQEHMRLSTIGVARSQIHCALLLGYGCVAMVCTVVGMILGHVVLHVLLPVSPPTLASPEVLIAGAKTLVLSLIATTVIVWCVLRHATKMFSRFNVTLIGVFAFLATFMLLNFESGLLGAEAAIVLACLTNVAIVVPLLLGFVAMWFKRVQENGLLHKLNRAHFVNTIEVSRPIICAMSFALANAIGIDLMVSSFKVNFLEMLDSRLSAGVYLTNVSGINVDELRNLNGIEEIRKYTRTTGRTAEGKVEVILAELDEWELKRYVFDGYKPASLIVNEMAARRLNLHKGSLVTLDLIQGESIQTSVDHVYQDYGGSNSTVVLSNALIQKNSYPISHVTILGNPTLIQGYVQSLLGQHPNLSVRIDTEIRALAEYIFDQTFLLTRVMTFIALAVAVLGLACALTIFLASRTTEFRLLVTIGVSKFHLVKSNLVQAMGLGVVTIVSAIPLSILIAWILCEVVQPRAFGWRIDLEISIWSVIYPSILCLIAAVFASIGPIRRAITRIISQPIPDIA